MKLNKVIILTAFLALSLVGRAGEGLSSDSIYGGTQVKIDILSPVLTPGLNNWQMQHYEIAANVQLAHRFYPTLELGYAGGKTHNDSVQYNGQGGFARIGCDINPLKKHGE